MIVPTARDVLATIEHTLATVVVPDAGSVAARSALATTGHLLRHVQLRLELEGQLLLDDIAALRPLLADLLSWLEERNETVPGISAAMDKVWRGQGAYPTLASLADEAGALRHALTEALERLIALRDSNRHDPAYLALRERVRAYLARQIRSEAAIIDPAFEGKGARR
ncbi:hypothetical protein [Rhizorhabdus argentea]|uniref:hypothetical protein n=1 Tax=Rhizorhabdus argentea TaxID=1387174 RepID=UPI0030EE6DCD